MVTTVAMLICQHKSNGRKAERFKEIQLLFLFCKCGNGRINSKAGDRAGKPVMNPSQLCTGPQSIASDGWHQVFYTLFAHYQ